MLASVFNRIGLKVKLFLVTAGIYISYLYFGILQEHIYTNPNRERFYHSEFVVFCQTVVGYFVSSLGNFYSVIYFFLPPMPEISNTAEKFKYSASFSFAMIFTNFSLIFISYPTQALAKSCKILPVMIGSLFVKGVSYHPIQYVSVLMITIGILIFNSDNKKGSGNDSIIGLILLGGSLFMDSITGYYNEIFRRNYKPNGFQTMQVCCGYGSILLAIFAVFLNFFVRESNVFIYLYRYPQVFVDIMAFSLVSAIGQIFIFWGLNLFGSLSLIIITTTRKFMTVIVSIIIFNHSLTETQWLCISLVFLGTIADFFVSHFMEPKKKPI